MRPETTLFCQWNERAGNFVANIRINTWFYISCKKCWNFERDVASLPAHRCVQRLLSWHLLKARRVGRPRHMWESKTRGALPACGFRILGKNPRGCGTLWNWHPEKILVSFWFCCFPAP